MNKDEQILEMLKSYNVTKIEEYCLVNNYGYTFNIKENRYDLRHWLNVYGVDTDFWSIHQCNNGKSTKKERELIKEISRKANEINERKVVN